MNEKYYIFNTYYGMFKNGDSFTFKEQQSFSLEEAKKIIEVEKEEYLKIINENEKNAILEKDYLETMVYELGNLLCNSSILSERADETIKKCFVDYVNRLLDYYNPMINESNYDYYKVFARQFGKEIKKIKKDPNDENMF